MIAAPTAGKSSWADDPFWPSSELQCDEDKKGCFLEIRRLLSGPEEPIGTAEAIDMTRDSWGITRTPKRPDLGCSFFIGH